MLCLTVLLPFISCGKEVNHFATLSRIEAMIEQSPEDALDKLLQIERPKEMPKNQYALWCLLLTQANDKNYITHTSDSLIRIATDYFEKTQSQVLEAQCTLFHWKTRIAECLYYLFSSQLR